MYHRTLADVMASRPRSLYVEPSEDDLYMDRFFVPREQGGSGYISNVTDKIGIKLFPKWRPTPNAKGTPYEGIYKKENHYPYHNFCGERLPR